MEKHLLRWKEYRAMVDSELKSYEPYLPLWNLKCPLWLKVFVSCLKRERWGWTMRWQVASRWADYWQDHHGLPARILHAWYVCRRNGMAMKLGIEMTTKNVGWGLLIVHAQGIVVHGDAFIGDNFHMTGLNCVGKGKPGRDECPRIGNNVTLGIGAKVLGDVELADDIRVGAGAVVIRSCTMQGATLVGIPAREVVPGANERGERNT